MTDQPKVKTPEEIQREFYHVTYDLLKAINGKLTFFTIILILWIVLTVIGWFLR